jgi:hypothetical protein
MQSQATEEPGKKGEEPNPNYSHILLTLCFFKKSKYSINTSFIKETLYRNQITGKQD